MVTIGNDVAPNQVVKRYRDSRAKLQDEKGVQGPTLEIISPGRGEDFSMKAPRPINQDKKTRDELKNQEKFS
jgi:hypothetical protein